MNENGKALMNSAYNGDGLHGMSKDIAQGLQLRDLRVIASISPSDLADQVGITPKELQAMEEGSMIIRKAQALRLAGVLSVQYSDLWLVDDC